jgi:hypothetical protein
MALPDVLIKEITFDIGRQDEIRDYDRIAIYALVHNASLDAVDPFAVSFAIDHHTTELFPMMQGLAGGAEQWITVHFEPLAAGEHHVSVYLDPRPDGVVDNPLDVVTVVASYPFTVHPPFSMVEPEHQPSQPATPHGATDVTVVLSESRGGTLFGYQVYVAFNGDSNQTFSSDKAGGDTFRGVAIAPAGSAVVWAVPIAGATTNGVMLNGNTSYQVHDDRVFLRGQVQLEKMQVSATSSEEASKKVSGKIGGEVNILDVVKLGAERTEERERKVGESHTVTWEVSYTTGQLDVKQEREPK